ADCRDCGVIDLDPADEPVTLLRYRPDPRAVIVERGACEADRALHRTVGDQDAGPQLGEQLGLGHDAIAMPDQILQDRKHARLKLAHPSGASQLALSRIELEGVEPICDPGPTA